MKLSFSFIELKLKVVMRNQVLKIDKASLTLEQKISLTTGIRGNLESRMSCLVFYIGAT